MKKLFLTLTAVGCLQAPLFAKDVDIAVSELPKAVSEAVSKAHPNAKILSAEKDLKANGDIQHFEVTIRDGDNQKELTVTPDGAIQKTEKDN